MESEFPVLETFITVAPDSDFSIHNIPFGVIIPSGSSEPRVASAIGNFAIDLSVLEAKGLFNGPLFTELNKAGTKVFNKPTLNAFMSLTRPYWKEARTTIQSLLSPSSALATDDDLRKQVFLSLESVKLLLPAQIGDYTDFYSSRSHAYNIGCIVRGPENAIQPNWLHLPVGYHGRSSSVVVSGTDVLRPRGQIKPPDKEAPIFSECKRMDFELEIGAFVGGKTNEQGHPVKVNSAEDNIFGLVLLNDWSARDIQVWEYVPLGPFNAKNFSTVISPWVVTIEALDAFRVELEKQDPEPLPYLKETRHTSFDINLDVFLHTAKGEKEERLVKSNFRHLYWSVNQQLTHHTVTGCNLRPGDLLGSGTISGNEKESFGSMMELSWSGKNQIKLSNGEERTFLQDGDTVIMRGFCERNGVRVGFGECKSKVLPALPLDQFA